MFDAWHEPWQFDGPMLNIEFSRISESRKGALTLVIDSKNGVATQVAYCLSKRTQISEAAADLTNREKTGSKNIGFVHASGRGQHRDKISKDTIAKWCTNKAFDVVVWTDLASNFDEKTGRPFSVDAAADYLQALNEEGQLMARQYMAKAPDFVRTPLRTAFAEH